MARAATSAATLTVGLFAFSVAWLIASTMHHQPGDRRLMESLIDTAQSFNVEEHEAAEPFEERENGLFHRYNRRVQHL
jgi:hypothetical protein